MAKKQATEDYDATSADDDVMSFGEFEDELEKSKGIIIPAGQYTLVLKKWEFKRSRQKGSPGVNFYFEVVGQPEYKNAMLIHWSGWNTIHLRRTLLALCGKALAGERFTMSDVEEGSWDIVANEVGTEVEAIVKVEEYTDDETEDVVKSNKISKFLVKK